MVGLAAPPPTSPQQHPPQPSRCSLAYRILPHRRRSPPSSTGCGVCVDGVGPSSSARCGRCLLHLLKSGRAPFLPSLIEAIPSRCLLVMTKSCKSPDLTHQDVKAEVCKPFFSAELETAPPTGSRVVLISMGRQRMMRLVTNSPL